MSLTRSYIYTGTLRFFQVLRPLYRGRAQNFSKSNSLWRLVGRFVHGLLIGGRFGIYLSPKTYIKGKSSEFFQVQQPLHRRRTRNFSRTQGPYKGKNSKFSQVPRPLHRRSNFSKSYGFYIRGEHRIFFLVSRSTWKEELTIFLSQEQIERLALCLAAASI